jgi:hypothetical protein
MGDGLSLVYHDRFDGQDHFYRVSVDSAGDATTDGDYGPYPTDLFWPYYTYGLVLDAEGDLYVASARSDSLAGRSSAIVKFPFGGDPSVVADNAEHPYIDTNNAKLEDAFVSVDLQSPLFSGPTLRF